MDPRLLALLSQQGGQAPQAPPAPSLSDVFAQHQQKRDQFEMQKLMAPALLKAQTGGSSEIPEDPAMRLNMEDVQHRREMDTDMQQFMMKMNMDREMGMMDMAQKGMLERMRIDKMPTQPANGKSSQGS